MKTMKYIAALFLIGTPFCFALNRADLLPADSTVRFHVSGTRAFIDAVREAPLGRLWRDEQMQAFLNLPRTNLLQNVLGSGEGAAAEANLKQYKLITGEFAGAVSFPEGDFFFAVELSPEEYRTYSELQEKINEAEKITRKNHTFQGVTLIEEFTDESKPHWRAYFKNTELEGSKREQIEKSIMLLKKSDPEPVISERPFLNVSCPASKTLQTAVATLQQKQSPDKPLPFNPDALLKASGLAAVRNIDFTLSVGREETRIEYALEGLNAETGLFSLLKTEPARLPPADFIPDDLFYFELYQIDIPAFWAEIQNMLTAANPMFGMQFTQLPAMFRQLCGVDLQQDVFPILGNAVISYYAPGAAEPRIGVAFELKDGKSLQNIFNKILTAPAFAQQSAAIRQEPFRDTVIYEIDAAQSGESVAFCIMPDYLFYGTGEDVRTMIRSVQTPAETGSYLDSKLIREMKEFAPAGAFALKAVDGPRYAAVAVKELAKPQYRQMFKEQKWQPDFSKMPSGDHLGSFFGTACSWAEKQSDSLKTTIVIRH